MTVRLIPVDAQRAAQRAFLRTLAQGYASSLAGVSVSAATVLAWVENPDWTLLLVLLVVWLVAPVVGAASAFFSVLHRGIPEDYAATTPEGGRTSA